MKNMNIKGLMLFLIVSASVTFKAGAGMIYEISGDITPDVNNSFTGSFSIMVDSDDLQLELFGAHPNLPTGLVDGPWYSYDVLSADVSIDVAPLGSLVWSESDIRADFNEPALSFGGLTSELWLTSPIDDTFQDMSIVFENSDGLLFLGFQTGGLQSVIINQVIFDNRNNIIELGTFTNVAVSKVKVSEPHMAILFGLMLTSLLLVRAKHRA
ncbi:hypothetical protein [Vibrio alfacsensis]|uniref:hypothetical protein n=1 Tax=Vibrio alfacsensis TaxID=1074311 RepID=UPI001BEEFE4F|nr:hypothetical protein [Vibrio alfacsensis]BCN26485.1 hypothetical protein VYA_36770 [Vibrio alfacsensis]